MDKQEQDEMERILMATGQITGPGRPEIDLSDGVTARLEAGTINESYLWAVAYEALGHYWNERGSPLLRDLPLLYQQYRAAGDIQFTWENRQKLVVVCDGARCFFYEDAEAQTKSGYAEHVLPLKAQVDQQM